MYSQDESTEAEIYELSPFEITSGDDQGYNATETLAGTRLRTSVGDIGGAMDIFTKELLEDIGADDFESALLFATNTEEWEPDLVSNPAGANSRDDISYSVRGFKVTSLSRDFFNSLYGGDGYNMQRITFSRGPNSILYGIAQPGGIANSMTMRANFRESNKLTANYDSNGGHRATASVNRVLIEDKLAIVANTLYKQKESWIDGVFTRDKRLHLALKYRPFGKSEGFLRDLELNLSHEEGKSKSQMLGRNEPISDGVSEWIAAGKPLIDNINPPRDDQGKLVLPDGIQQYNSSRRILLTKGVSGDDQDIQTLNWDNTFVGSRPTEIRSLTDQSIIPYDVNYLGNSKVKQEDFRTSQLFVTKKIGGLYLDLALNEQKHGRFAQDELTGYKLDVDPNMYLPNSTPDNLIPNPNAGKYYIQGSWVRHQPIHDRTMRTARMSASYDLDFQGRDNFMKHLGRFRFAAMREQATRKSYRQFSRLYNLTPDATNDQLQSQSGFTFPSYTGNKRFQIPAEYGDIRNSTPNSIVFIDELGYHIQTKTGPVGGFQSGPRRGFAVDPETGERLALPVLGSGTSAANSPNIRSYIDPEQGFYSTGGLMSGFPGYNPPLYGNQLTADGYTVSGYPGLVTDENGVTLALAPDIPGGKSYEKRISETYTMQHYLFGGRIVTTLGWRSDDVDSWGLGRQATASRFDNGYYFWADTTELNPRESDADYLFKAGDPTTKSIVVKPNDFLSFFYSEADNFNPVGPGNNIYGDDLVNPSGVGEDAGIRLNFGAKLNLSLSVYRNSSEGQRQAKIRTGTRFPISNQDRISNTFWDHLDQIQNNDLFVTSDTTDYLSSPYKHNRSINWTGSQSVESEGVEFRMTLNPTKQWRMLINYSTQDSQINEVGADLYSYWHEFVPSVLEKYPEYLGANPDGETFMNVPTKPDHKFLTYRDRGNFPVLTVAEFVKGAQDDAVRLRDLIGFSDSSQPKSSIKFISSYTFAPDSHLKGWAVGVNARYSGDRTLGYQIKDGPGARLDAANSYKGGSMLSTGGFIRFRKKIGNFNYTGQLQITNLFDDTDLVAFGTDKAGNGDIIRYRFQAPRTFDFRNTISF